MQQNNHNDKNKQTFRGPLAWFAGNSVAANLLMLFIIVAGIMALLSIKIEIFPEFSVDRVTVSVPYLGAAPEEVEQGVILRVEEAIAGVEGIERITSTASEGIGFVVAEIDEYADTREVMDDIKVEVDRIDTFPEETERPIITENTNRRQVLNLMIYGDADEHTLKNLAEEIRDDLTVMENITLAEISGVRENEISIEISEENLRRYNLSFQQVSEMVRRSSLDLPGGDVETQAGVILIRTKGQRYHGDEFADIIIRSLPDGTRLRLGDIATVVDGFRDSDKATRFDGQPAALVRVYRIGQQGALDIAETVKQYIRDKEPELPAGVKLAIWEDRSDILRSRIELLVRNASYGLALVFLILTFFLDLRLAFWTTMGIVISFLGAFWIMPMFGVSVNMISLFAFIVVLGIVVDDAIVVGENIFDYRLQGEPPLKAAILGVRELWMPVTIAILTTVAAFVPMLHVSGIMGKIFRNIPIVVISVLLMSLVDALFILPAHMSHGKARKSLGPIARFQKKVRAGLDWFVNVPFLKFLHLAVKWRYITLACALAILIIIVGLIRGGRIEFIFFPKVESDNVTADLEMPQGTPRQKTERILRDLEQTALDVIRNYDENHPDKEKSLLVHMSTFIGELPAGGGPGGGEQGQSGSHVGRINLQLLESRYRDIGSTEIASRWRKKVGEIPGVSSLTFSAELFSPGKPVFVELSHSDFNTLLRASEQLKQTLGQYAGVQEIADSFEPGKLELKLDLTDLGRAQQLTLQDLGWQMRQGFYGDESQRIQRGRNDIRVMVRYPEDQRTSLADVENTRIRLPDGTEIPFLYAAQADLGRGYADIQRSDRRRVVRVTADVDEEIGNANQINADLQQNVIPELQNQFPGLVYDFQGAEKERQESLQSLARNFVVALFAIYGLLAIQFRSYLQPLIIMSAIPFGIVGAVLGHLLLGFDLSLLSMFGIVALTGVVVNDSLIMIDLINRRRSGPANAFEAVQESATRRFRPILLTTLTTFFGLTPMILEKSLQARFLIPMAISLGFGVLFATAITLVLIPALYMILVDLKTIVRRLRDWFSPPTNNTASTASQS